MNVDMVGTRMLCGNGQSLCVRYHGWHMDALRERTESSWTLTWLAHGCPVGTDGVFVDVNIVGTWMLCGNGRSLCRRYHGWHKDALWERTESVAVNMVGTWMRCGNGRSLCGVNMVDTWMHCGNGRSLCGRKHGWHMAALRERTWSWWTLSANIL